MSIGTNPKELPMHTQLMSSKGFTQGIEVGMKVRRTQGRPENVGRTGTVSWVGAVAVGGDVLMRATAEDGSEWEAYTRQVRAI